MNDQAKPPGDVSRRQNGASPRPRDAATLIVVDSSGREPKVLMGRRHERHVFMPGKFVFPGGSVDPGDSRLAVPERLDKTVEQRLLIDMKGTPSPRRAQGIALAAIRETGEETGLLIGTREGAAWKSASPAWRPFTEKGITPALSALSFFCRAITPPRRPRRFDTRFFCVSAALIAERITPDNDELLDLHWLTFAEALELDLPTITRAVLEELREKTRAGGLPDAGAPVPYYYMRNGVFRRELL